MTRAPSEVAPIYRILLVDDNPAIHQDFKKILGEGAGGPEFNAVDASLFGEEIDASCGDNFEIDSAVQGKDALDLVTQSVDEGRPYSMAFIDVRMPPGWDGIETIARIWAVYPDLQVVLCTAYADYSWDEMIAKLGRSDRLLILKKPFDPVEALQLAWALCEKWKLTLEACNRLAETERIVEERTHELRGANERLCAEIEHRNLAEAHLRRAQRVECIGTLASGIAHDLNNMLAPILLSAEILGENLAQESADRELISLIESSARRAARVVKQVLTFASGLTGERLPLLPAQLVREMEAIITETFPQRIQLETRVSGDISMIKGDSTQLHQVILNLCVNARDAMPDGGVLRIEVDDFHVEKDFADVTRGARPGPYVRLRVSDTGVGIPRHVLEKIFDPFFTTKPLGKGSGLGLSTVIGIVKSHEGFIDVQSEPGKGSTFEVFLPAALDCFAGESVDTECTEERGHGELILVVDDESAVRNALQRLLHESGYRTLAAVDGAEALSIFENSSDHIDAVLTDVMMPRMDGMALCRALRNADPKVGIIVSTAHGDAGVLNELRSLNIGHVLNKPFALNSVLAALGGAITQATSPVHAEQHG